MRRQDKYPDTSTFHYYNANPKNRITGDCRIRAIATACRVRYNEVVFDLADIQCETGYDQTASQGLNLLLKKYGWVKCGQPKRKDGTKYTGNQFCRVMQEWIADREMHGNEYKDGIIISPWIVANIGGHHMVAIMHGRIYDTWNSGGGCIGNYWIPATF